MAYSIDVNHARRIIVVTLTGEVAPLEIVEYTVKLMKDPYVNLPYGVVFDYRQSKLVNPDPAVVHSIRNYLSENRSLVVPFRLTILATRAYQIGLGRMFQNMVEGDLPIKILITSNEKDAYRWATRPFENSQQ